MRLLQFRVGVDAAQSADDLAAMHVGLGKTVVQRLIFLNGLLRIRERGQLLIESGMPDSIKNFSAEDAALRQIEGTQDDSTGDSTAHPARHPANRSGRKS